MCDNYAPAREVLAKRFSRAVQYSDVADLLIELERGAAGQASQRKWTRAVPLPSPRLPPEPEDACRVMESLMGLPRGWVTDLGLSISAQRRLLGNGVVPAQGALGIYRAITDPINN